MAGLLIQPEGLLRRRSISSALVIAVENKPGDGLPSKRSFYCKPILDFIETRVCSLVYKFAFSIDCVSHLHFAPFEGEMAMSVRACLDLLPGLDSCGPDFSRSQSTVRTDGHTV